MKRHLQAKGGAWISVLPEELSRVERKQKSVTLERKQWFFHYSRGTLKGTMNTHAHPWNTLGTPGVIFHVDLAWEGGQIHFNPLQSVEADDLVILLSLFGLRANFQQGVQDMVRNQTWCTVIFHLC